MNIKRNKTYDAKPNESGGNWRVVDAEGKPLGRVASEIAMLLMGKHLPTYTPYVLSGDFVIVINAAKVGLTGGKATEKIYYHYSGYPSGLSRTTFKDMAVRHPDHAIKEAVKGMLPKTTLGDHMFKRLKVYAGAEHPHQAQIAGSQKKQEQSA